VAQPAASESLPARLKREYGAKVAKFGAVSVFNVVFGQSLLFFAQEGLDWSPVASNVFAVMISAVPAYVLARYWVWQKRGKNHFLKEVVPFWSLAFAGLVLSTIAVWVVSNNWPNTDADGHPPAIIVNLTNLAAFGVVWVCKFFILERVLFKDEELTDEPLDALLDEALHHHHGDDAR
jgi:putative flippase GtrA